MYGDSLPPTVVFCWSFLTFHFFMRFSSHIPLLFSGSAHTFHFLLKFSSHITLQCESQLPRLLLCWGWPPYIICQFNHCLGNIQVSYDILPMALSSSNLSTSLRNGIRQASTQEYTTSSSSGSTGTGGLSSSSISCRISDFLITAKVSFKSSSLARVWNRLQRSRQRSAVSSVPTRASSYNKRYS